MTGPSKKTVRFKIKHLKETISTNTLAIQEAKKDAAEGLVIWADHQTGGRGQFERKWISPPGKNLLFSILLRPNIAPSKAPLVTQIACQTVLKTLRDLYGIESSIKRPNDVLVNGKKICGILTEASTGSQKQLEYIVLGIGLNVNASQEQLIPEATSVIILKDKTYNRERLLKSLLAQLKKDLKPLYPPTHKTPAPKLGMNALDGSSEAQPLGTERRRVSSGGFCRKNLRSRGRRPAGRHASHP